MSDKFYKVFCKKLSLAKLDISNATEVAKAEIVKIQKDFVKFVDDFGTSSFGYEVEMSSGEIKGVFLDADVFVVIEADFDPKTLAKTFSVLCTAKTLSQAQAISDKFNQSQPINADGYIIWDNKRYVCTSSDAEWAHVIEIDNPNTLLFSIKQNGQFRIEPKNLWDSYAAEQNLYSPNVSSFAEYWDKLKSPETKSELQDSFWNEIVFAILNIDEPKTDSFSILGDDNNPFFNKVN